MNKFGDQVKNAILRFFPTSRDRDWFLGALLFVAVIIAYQPAWRAGFVWDDDKYVTNNPLLSAPDGLKRIWFSMDSPSQYFPLTYTTFRLEHALWGFNPADYHCFNILLHAVNALLVWQLLKRLSVPGAWLAAAIFALHPVQVESVAWIAELKSVLSLLFILLALLSWIEFVQAQPKRLWRCYGWTLVFYALALFSKTTACTLPAVLLLILWLKEKRIDWLRLAQVVPFLAMGFGMGLLAIWWERFHQGTQGKLFSMGLLERILVASHAVWFYAGKLVWPSNLIFSYPRWTINPADPFAYGWLVAGVGLSVAIVFVRRFVGRSVEVAVLFFVVTLSPLLGFIMLYTFRYSFVADHYQYAACIGFFALVAAGITTAFGFLGKRNQFLKLVFCGVLLLTLGVLTWRQCVMYANFETLMRTTIQRNPDSSMAHNNLGSILLRKGQVDEAIIHLQTALEIDPDNAEPHNNLGNALLQKGQIDEAIVHYQKSVEINPKFAGSQFNLGLLLFQKGRVDEAITHYQKAVEINPNFAPAQNNLGLALFQKGRVDEAITHYQRAAEINPNFPGSQFNLGSAFLQKGQVDEAIIYFQKALEINPNYPEAYNSLGFALYKKGRVDEAIESAQQALQLATAQNNASLVDAIQKQIEFYHASPSLNDDSLTNTPAHSSHP